MDVPQRQQARRARALGRRIRSAAWLAAIGASAVLTACAGGDLSGVGPTMAFGTQPGNALASQPITPPVEVMLHDVYGQPLSGAVTLELYHNPCNWTVAGTVALAVGGVARFPDLAVGQVVQDMVVLATSGSLAATSDSFDVESPLTNERLLHETTICSKPNAQTDAESLSYVPEDDAFWIADDNQLSIYQVDRRSGRYLSHITVDSLLQFLPTAGVCDDGDGDSLTTCSYLTELEHVSYDPPSKTMYLVNTVNNPSVDRPAIFRLRRSSCAGCFVAESWQPLPLGPTYSGIAVIGGTIFMANGTRIYPYDYATNRLLSVDANGDPLPPAYSVSRTIWGLSYDGTFLWILEQGGLAIKVDWATKTERGRQDLVRFGLTTPKGIEAFAGRVYVVEGEPPNPIYQFLERVL